ncbi:MAG: HAD family hydrolase [Chloroflexi bacterium]|nr:HAD family hydrolase [Chloroflexota bacterium]
MIKALLFDMDGTLVDISMQTFLPQYFGALSKKLAHLVAPEKLIVQLHASTKVMMNNSDPTRMLVDAFSADFFPKLGLTREQLEPLFHDFYATEYRALSTYARRVAGVREVLTRAFAATRKVALATGPFFPLTAITQRLEWGGVGDFPYALVTSYETMHTSKPHAAYYREIATQLDVAPEECVMIGDDPQMDMTPARRAGMKTFWITNDGHLPTDVPADWRGTLTDVGALLERGELVG